MDIDVAGDRLLVLGTRMDYNAPSGHQFAPDGTIAWIGSLDKDLSDLRPVLADARGAGAPDYSACSTFGMGAVRFLGAGSFIVVPGVQPGAYLYDARARLVRTWDTVGLGLDSDCASLTEEQIGTMAVDFTARAAWLNRRRTLEEVLPLPEGPGLVVRRVVEGRVRWRLEVLGNSGVVGSYEIPIVPDSLRTHLRGDVRNGKIAFLVVSHSESVSDHRHPPSRLVIAVAADHR